MREEFVENETETIETFFLKPYEVLGKDKQSKAKKKSFLDTIFKQ